MKRHAVLTRRNNGILHLRLSRRATGMDEQSPLGDVRDQLT